ncbi:PEP-CTERM motif protein [Poriferisphaera corsica]|uniref:PEP-CTERM motif protein n=1 Tax=Poriferisphaera corsica TaxID=2528020 RepID=A0A517YTP0_9BACT|nr:PEP-CTERM sorting domain-containing protein [Poriferisphaera corsica]QDU33594.1 PEP-CTERM motif protein [Poriferisphaera corsica]
MSKSFSPSAIAASAILASCGMATFTSASMTVDGIITAADGYTYNQEMSFTYKNKGKGKDADEHIVAPETAWFRHKVNTSGIQVALTLPTGYVDNSYGDNSVGWDKNHKLTELSGSDKAYFLIRDKNNHDNNIFLKVDYLARKLEIEDKGKDAGKLKKNEYKDESKAKINGGKEIKADEKDANKLDPFWSEFSRSSSMEWNMNNFMLDGSGGLISGSESLVTDSPDTVSDSSYDLVDPSSYSDWRFDVTYEFSLTAAALAGAGITEVEILLQNIDDKKADEIVHASPSKYPENSIGNFTPVPEPASIALLLCGAGMVGARRRKNA